MQIEILSYEPIPQAQMKSCPRCPSQGRAALHAIEDFGICRARKDGLNLYCKDCIREKVRAHRIRLRAYKKIAGSRKKTLAMRQAPVTRLRLRRGHPLAADFKTRMRRLPHAERIILSLSTFGNQSFPELRHSCRLTDDQLSDALVDVVGNKVGSRNGSGPRVYFIHTDETRNTRVEIPHSDEPRSFGVSTIYQSSEPEIRGMSRECLHNK